MKSLMDVIKTLIKVNLVLALLTFIVVMVVREKEPKMMSEASQFQRDLEAIPSEDQQKIAENSQKIAQLQKKLQQEALSSEYQRKMAEYSQKIANLQAKSQEKNLSSEERGQMAEYGQKIANLQEKFQEKDQKIQQLQRQLTAYQQSQTAQKKITKTEIPSNSAKNPIKNPSSVAQVQSNPQPHKIASVTPTPSPVEPSRSQSEYGLSKNSIPQSMASVTLKKEIIANLAPSSALKTVQKQPSAIESNSDIAMISLPKEFSEGEITSLEQQKPVLEQQKQDNQGKSSVISKDKTPRDKSIHMANDLAVGLIVADKQKHINRNTRKYKQVQTAIRSLRLGTSTTLEQAAQMSGLKPSILAQVVKWGKDRPGSFESDNQISLVQSK